MGNGWQEGEEDGRRDEIERKRREEQRAMNRKRATD